MILRVLLGVALALASDGRAAAQAHLSGERPAVDLHDHARVVWPHATGELDVEVRIDRDGGPCVVRVARRAVADFDVGGVYFDPEQHVAGPCYGRATLVDEGDLMIEVGTVFGDGGEPGSSRVVLLSRRADGTGFVSTSGGRSGGDVHWHAGHGAPDAITRAVASCTRASDDELSRAWARVEMLRATVSERGDCTARWVTFMIDRGRECAGQEPGAQMSCLFQHAERLAVLVQQPVLAEHEVRARAAWRTANRDAERASRRALDALPPLSAEDPAEWLRQSESLAAYTDYNESVLVALGLEAELYWLDRDRSAAEALVRCLEARDRRTAEYRLRALERESGIRPELAARCRERHEGSVAP